MKKTTRLISGALAFLLLFSTLAIAQVPTVTSQGDLRDVVRTAFGVTPTDITPPVITSCSTVSYTTSSTSTFTAVNVPALQSCLLSASSLDGIDGVVSVTNNAPTSYTPVIVNPFTSTYTITFSSTDSSGNLATKAMIFTVTYSPPSDTTPPVVTAPSNISIAETSAGLGVSATNPSILTFLGSGSAIDAVDGVVTVTTQALTGVLAVGSYPVVFSATDAAGNTGTATATITITAALGSGIGNGICTTAVDDGAGNIPRGHHISPTIESFKFLDVATCSPGGRGWDGTTFGSSVSVIPAYTLGRPDGGKHHGQCSPASSDFIACTAAKNTPASYSLGTRYVLSANRSHTSANGNITVYGGGSGTSLYPGFVTRCGGLSTSPGSGCGPGSGTKTYFDGKRGIGSTGGAPVCVTLPGVGSPTVCSGRGGNSVPAGNPGASGSCQLLINIPILDLGGVFSCHDYGSSSNNYGGTIDLYKGDHGNTNWRFHN